MQHEIEINILEIEQKSAIINELQIILKENDIQFNDDYVAIVCEQFKERATFIRDIWEEGKYYFIPPTSYDEKTIRKKWKENTPELLLELSCRLENINEFTSENIEVEFKSYLEEKELGMGRLLPVFRLSLTGLGVGPSIFNIASLLGKEEAIKRMQRAINKIK